MFHSLTSWCTYKPFFVFLSFSLCLCISSTCCTRLTLNKKLISNMVNDRPNIFLLILIIWFKTKSYHITYETSLLNIFLHSSYGILFGIGCAMVRETSTLMLSQYFKRKREVVEMIASTGTGCGIAIFSNVYRSGME